MKTEKTSRGREAGRYLVITLFCGVFSFIYNLFSHGIHSPWMTWLAAWPLLLGALPAGLSALAGGRNAANTAADQKKAGTGIEKADEKYPSPDRAAPGHVREWICPDLYRFGVAALTAASMLKGILEIAGTDSIYPDLLLYAGAGMTVIGAIGAAGTAFHRHRNA